jgi:predicted methyltransferase
LFSGLALRRRKTAVLSVKASNAMASSSRPAERGDRAGDEEEEEEESLWFARALEGDLAGEGAVGGGVWRASRWGGEGRVYWEGRGGELRAVCG